MVRKEYSAGGVKHPFWFLEFKKAAILRDQGVTWEGLRTRSREENLFSADVRLWRPGHAKAVLSAGLHGQRHALFRFLL